MNLWHFYAQTKSAENRIASQLIYMNHIFHVAVKGGSARFLAIPVPCVPNAMLLYYDISTVAYWRHMVTHIWVDIGLVALSG